MKQRTHLSAGTLQSYIPYIVFAVTTMIFFSGHLFGKMYFWDDFVEQVYPNRVFAAHGWAEGGIPFWNPYSFCGMPYMADVQSALFYPPNFIVDMLAGDGAYPVGLLQWMLILHFFIAQCGMYVLCRNIGTTSVAAMIAAVGYGFSSPLALHAFHPMQVEHLAWLPFIVSFFYTTLTKGSIHSMLYGGLLLGMTMLSGSPQMTLYISFFLGCMAVWFTISGLITKKESTIMTVRSGAFAILSLVIAVGVFCMQYLPSKELAGESERSEMTYEKATVGSLQFKQLITAAVPKAYGHITPESGNKAPFYLSDNEYYLYWDTAFYGGIIAFFLGLFALIALRKNPTVLFLGVMSLFAFLFALGSNGFLYNLFYQLPFFGSLRIPARMMFVWTFGFSVLAAFGFDEAARLVKSKQVLIPLLVAALLPVFFALGVSTGSLVDFPNDAIEKTVSSFGTTALFTITAGFAIVFSVHRGILSQTMGGYALVLLIFIDISVANSSFNNGKINPKNEYAQTYSEQLRQILQPRVPDSLFRVSMRTTGAMALKRNQGMTDGVMLYEGYNQLLLAKRHPAVPTISGIYDMLSIAQEIKVDPSTRSAGFEYRPSRFPMAWMTYQATVIPADRVKQAMKADSTTDYHNVTVLEENPSQSLSRKASADVVHSAKVTSYSNNEIEYSVETTEPGILCMSEVYYPAWKAYIDGTPAKVYRANYALRAVEVPAGKHTIQLRYESSAFKSGMLISLGTFAFCVLTLVIIQVSSMRSKGT
ncbi:MAG: YfhO family protein [Candidatus Kapabacteria bacterium]|nr:YfhO family protein [Candidatus Kapabacteria bacterium]